MYVIQSTLLGSIAFIVGPIFGSLICRVLGATNGFMSFVDRASVPININLEVRLYALIAFVLYMVCVLIPAFKACKTSIVQYKVKKNIVVTKSFWERIYLDIIFLGISFYGYYGYMIDQDNLGDAIVSGGRIDPLMFLISALFLLGANLFLIRMYPYLIRFIFFIGRKIWGPVLYFSLLNVSRAEQTSKFIMLFIMLALSFGIINSSQARTLNLNTEQRVYYNDGPDVIVSPYEDPKLVPDNYINMFLDMYPPDGIRDILTEKFGYFNYENLEGIDGITRVFTHDEVNLNERGTVISNVHMLAIEPDSFLDAAWIRDDFLPEHPNVYMNAMIKAPSGVFLSSQFRDDYGMTEGDVIRLSWDQSKKEADDGEFVGIIYGFIDVFPTYNPYHMVEIFKDQQVKEIIPETTPFALANLNFIEETNNIRNIDIWLSKEDGITDDEIQEQLVEKELEVKRVFYTNQDLIDAKRDAQLQGTNGVLTMSFVIIMLVTIMGYLIFWVMTMKGRALKFGIFRAMGMSFSQVNQIIIIEQILMTGVSIVFGSLVGIIGSKIFVPMLQKVGSPADQLPPFVVVILSSDILRTIGIATGMLLIGVIVLYVIVRRFKVNQVLKLGED
jgi:putative ABC transport system permease protein